ncbi:MAG: VanW family protein, partial [Clostridiales bacterium]|nr:VanW family protein [Clostridiales bacterium]
MKKNGNGSDRNNLPSVRPGVRSAYKPEEAKEEAVKSSASEITERPKRVDRPSSESKNSKGSKSKTKPVSKKKGAPKALIAVIAAVAVVGGAAAGVLYKKGYFDKKYDLTYADGTVVTMTADELRASLQTDTYLKGVTIDGVDVGGMTKDAGKEAARAAEPEQPFDYDITLSLDGDEYPLDLSGLTFSDNLDAVSDEAFNYLKLTGNEDAEALISIFNAREALKTAPKDFTVEFTPDSTGVDPVIHDLLDDMSSEAVDAEITGFDEENLIFLHTESSRGYVVDIDTAISDVKALIDAGTYSGTVTVNAEVEEPSVTSEDIENDFGLISSASSTTSASSNRNHNISITCEKLDQLVLEPGESFSFNGYIGQRTSAAGYLEAGVIANGALEQGLGGGVCQVSSMLYQAAVKANLQIDERHEHMWPSSYAVAGTDAAVDWPDQDFAFTNDSGYPIIITAYWNPDNSVITINFYGHMLPDGQYIDFIGETTSTSSAGVQYVPNESMEVGEQVQTRAPHNGVTAVGYQVWYDADGNEIDRVALPTSHYATVSAIIEVGVLNSDGSIASLDGESGELSDVVDDDDDDDD